MRDRDDYCRIFILGSKNHTEADFRQHFDSFGTITDFYNVRDKRTNESKGIFYITYSKASEAALAIEKMNGKAIDDSSRTIKVILANSRNEGNVRDPAEEEKMRRLFILVPKSMSESDIEQVFKEYGSVESVQIVTNKKTGESRGLAYVKYFRAYHAALALENCDSGYKPIFATSKYNRSHSHSHSDSQQSHGRGESARYPGGAEGYGGQMYPMMDYRPPVQQSMPAYPMVTDQQYSAAAATSDPLFNYPHHGETVLDAVLSKTVNQRQVSMLFDLIPCMEYCNYDQGTGVACVKYSMPQYAAYARDKLNGFEYPSGCHIDVRYYKDKVSVPMRSNLSSESIQSSLSALSQSMSSGAQGDLETLVSTIHKATNLLQQAGLSIGGSGKSGASRYCTISLPEPKPITPSDSNLAERLFIVSQPEAFPNDILEDCFCRFGNLISSYFLSGKNYGYAKFSDSESARMARETLHGQVICGNRLKVIPAEPPKNYAETGAVRGKRMFDYNGENDDVAKLSRSEEY